MCNIGLCDGNVPSFPSKKPKVSVSFAGRSCWKLSAAVCGRVKQTEWGFLSGCKSQRATGAALKTLQKDYCNRLGQLTELPCWGKQACKQFLSSFKLMQQFSTTGGSFYPLYFHQASLWKNAPHKALPKNYFYTCKLSTDLFNPDVWLKGSWMVKEKAGQNAFWDYCFAVNLISCRRPFFPWCFSSNGIEAHTDTDISCEIWVLWESHELSVSVSDSLTARCFGIRMCSPCLCLFLHRVPSEGPNKGSLCSVMEHDIA